VHDGIILKWSHLDINRGTQVNVITYFIMIQHYIKRQEKSILRFLEFIHEDLSLFKRHMRHIKILGLYIIYQLFNKTKTYNKTTHIRYQLHPLTKAK